MAYDDFFNALGSGINLYGQLQGGQNAGNINQDVQQSLGQNAGTLQQQIADLQTQIAQGRQTAQSAYQQAQQNFAGQNPGIQANIDTMTQNLTALSDPNSPYMKQARQAMERKDAAAGRRSQWGERETQLAAMLADYVGKYSPGIQNAITQGRGQLAQNEQTLAQLYANMNNAGSQQQQTLNQLLQQQQRLAEQQHTTGRQSSNASTNNNTQMLQSALGLGRGLFGMLNGGSSGEGDNSQGYGTSGFYDWTSPTQADFISQQLGGDYYAGIPSVGGDPYSSYDGGDLFNDFTWE